MQSMKNEISHHQPKISDDEKKLRLKTKIIETMKDQLSETSRLVINSF